jgi:PAS domain S-box-containing protein
VPEDLVAQQSEGLEEFLENAPVALHLLAPEGTILRASRFELELLGYQREAYEGRHIREFHADEGVAEDILRRLARGETLRDRPARLRAGDGSIRHVLINGNLRRDPEGNPVHSRCVLRDVSEIEERLRVANEDLARSNRDLEEFAYLAAHDLKEPLRVVIGFADLLRSRYAAQLGDEGELFVRSIVDATRRMEQLIDGLLDYARISSGDLPVSVVSFDDVCAEAIENLRRAIDDTGASVLTSGPLPKVVGLRSQLVQVVQNLIANSLKFRREEAPVVRISAERLDERVHVAVADNGTGFDARHAQRIFQLFQRLVGRNERAGAGIGLAVCRRIVERHGGEITAESEPGRGATFRFTLPAG